MRTISTLSAFLFAGALALGCSSNQRQDVREASYETGEAVEYGVEETAEAGEAAGRATVDATGDVVETTGEGVEAAGDAVEDGADATEDATDDLDDWSDDVGEEDPDVDL